MYIRVGTFYTNIIQILNFYLRKYIEFFKVFTFRKYFEEFTWKHLGIHFQKYFEEYIRKLLGTHFLKYFEEFIWKLLSIHFRKYFEEFIRKLLGIHFQKYFEEFIRKLLDIHFRKTFGHTFSEIFWRIYQKTFEQRFALPKTFLKFEFFQKLFYWPFYRIDIDISPLLVSIAFRALRYRGTKSFKKKNSLLSLSPWNKRICNSNSLTLFMIFSNSFARGSINKSGPHSFSVPNYRKYD